MQYSSSSEHKDSFSHKNQSTMTESLDDHNRTCSRLKLKPLLEFLSSLFLPLMLGVFTVVITFHQQNASDRQRIEDRHLAREQREQDLNLSRYQRAQDQEQSRTLREQDLTISRLQRELDIDIAEQRRQLDLNISRQQELSNLLIAEKQRNMTEQQRAHEINIEITRHRDDIFTAYINDMFIYINQYNGTPTEHPWIGAAMRAKTLTLIRQLDPIRNAHLIRFLYAASLLTNREHPPPLDLSEAELDGIDLSGWIHDQPMRGLSLAGAYLRNASFVKRDFSEANFSKAILDGAQFAPYTVLTGADFTGASLFKAKFYSEQVKDFSREDDSTSNTADFSVTRFNGCKCENARFDNAYLTSIDFSYANLRGATFVGASMDLTRLVGAIAVEANFTEAHLPQVNCTEMNGAGASFYRVQGKYIEFRNANLTGANFMWAMHDHSDFSEADMSYTLLTRCRLTESKWTKTNLFAANLSFAYMFNAYHLTDEQLFSAISIRETLLPNSTFGHDESTLVKNGFVTCNMNLTNMNDSWSWPTDGLIVIRVRNNDLKKCVFAPALSSTRPLSMSQKLDLRKYRPQIIRKNVILSLSASFGSSTIVALEWPKLNSTDSHRHILSKNIL
jgi:uncharacterized protein YjbI with pentapeptide repeats